MVYGRLKSRNWPLKNSSTEARSISASEMRASACDFHLRALEGSPQPNGMVHAAQVRSHIFWIDWPANSLSNELTADAWSRHGVRCIDEARECDVLLFVNGEDEQACGALIGACAPLAAGRQFVVSPGAPPFS